MKSSILKNVHIGRFRRARDATLGDQIELHCANVVNCNNKRIDTNFRDGAATMMDVVMCTWNSDTYWFRRCLASIRKEIPVHCFILVDRCSSDDTINIVKQFFPTTKVVQTVSKLAQQRQLGIKMVDTPWFLFCDDDIEFCKGWYRKVLPNLKNDIGAANGIALPAKETIKKFLLFLYKGWWRSRKTVATKENPDYMRGHAGNTIVRTDAVRDWKPPRELGAYEDHHLLRHVVGKGFRWIVVKDAFVTHHGVFNCRSEFKKANWNAAGARLIQATNLRKIITSFFSSVALGVFGSFKIRDPLIIPILVSMQLGFLQGYLRWNKYLQPYIRIKPKRASCIMVRM